MSEVVKLLEDARELISDEARWTRGSLARRSDGWRVPPSDPDAVCWCSIGSLQRCGGPHSEPYLTAYSHLKASAVQIRPPKGTDIAGPIGMVNDTLGHAGAKTMLNLAIKKARETD